jgi:hypothetical protein
MTIHALDTMKDSGRAAIIVGGHTEWDEYGRVRNGADRYFLSYLYHYYNVEDVINIKGDMYSKQGTRFPIRLILINGRKATPDGTAPLKTVDDWTVNNWTELWNRTSHYITLKGETTLTEMRRLAKAEKLALQMIAEMEKEMGLGGNQLFEYFTGSINDLIQIAKSKSNNLVKKIIGKPTEKQLTDYSENGLKINENFVHTIDNFAIKHTLNTHSGSDEYLRGLIPIVDNDFHKIKTVIEKYDSIDFDKNDRKQDVIIYSKLYADGTIVYVEEVRVKRNELAMDTMYKKKIKK